ncbi:3'(2'),5'-bisphosphate nucleotidase CysQ [uncultured Dokdonia sp.]|uniref:3'(2'),5'-bisphosphate nucleotidase CysQ n=1 Tax=uncultured Dokdonia sp. TaxID=575653 RepID=UPI0026322BAE|nr:3'(2'),5'-bisphosphate nucleotidase CysQ [uncultured Dokdonia sp.]
MISDQFKSIAVKAALQAGDVIREVYATAFGSILKSDDSPLTVADTRAHEVIYKELSATNIPVLSEEAAEIPYEERSTWDIFWLVDPLDGTKEFINRNGEFTVNIALIVGARPVYGIIYIPVSDTLYLGGSSLGKSYKISNPTIEMGWNQVVDDKHIIFTNKLKSQKEIRVVTSRSHLNEQTVAYIEDLKKNTTSVSLLPAGSALKFCMLAEGKADRYPRFAPCMEWDTAAGDAICETAGVTVFIAGTTQKLTYNKKSLFSPNFEAY